jgi:hypothetical protein
MSGWTLPASLDAFQQEGNAGAEALYQNIRNALNAANQRANASHQALNAGEVQFNEAKRLLAEANQRLQEARQVPEVAQLQELTQRLQQANHERDQTIDENMALEAQVTALQTQLALAQQAPQSQQPPPPPLAPLTPATQRSEKMPDPEKFGGERSKLPDFLTQMRLKLMANADRFLNENAKMMYIISRLEGAALRQIATFVDGVTIKFASPTALMEYLETSFGDPDPTGTARRELHELKQGKDFSAYLTEFRRIMGKLKYDDKAQMDCLETGLSPKLKDALVFTIRPETMATYETQLLQLDNRIRAREEEKKGTRSAMGQYTAPATTSSFTPGGLAPMDLSATQWQNRGPSRPHPNQRHEIINGIKKTTAAEKAWRRANNRCDFCGGEGHAYQNCPAKTNRPNPRYTMHGAALTTSSTPPPPLPPVTSTPASPPAGFQ